MLAVNGLCRPGLDPVTFEIEDGECLAVRGESGAGKTLILRALADLDLNEGMVTLDGQPRSAWPGPEWRRRVGYVAAESGWWADTVAEHYIDWSAAAPLAERLGLTNAAGSWKIERLSTGERQRLSLIRALERSPRLLLLDEPTSALHSDAVQAVEALVSEFRREDGRMVIWVTHDSSQATRVATRVLVVDHGHSHVENA